MGDYYRIEWETFDPLFDDGLCIGNDIHSEVTVFTWERACDLFTEKVKNDFCRACFVFHNEQDDPVLSYCP